MNNRKLAYRRYKELQTQKIGTTKIMTPQPKRGRLVRQDEIHAEMMDRFWEDVENKSIDLSRWDGQSSPWLHRELID